MVIANIVNLQWPTFFFTNNVRFTLMLVTLHGWFIISIEQDKKIGDSKYNV